MRKVIIAALIAFTGVALAAMPTSLSHHVSRLAGLSSFVEVSCSELGGDALDDDFAERMKCYWHGVGALSAMNSIDLYVDWPSRMSPWGIAEPVGSWAMDSSYPGGVFTRTFITDKFEAYIVFVFDTHVFFVHLL